MSAFDNLEYELYVPLVLNHSFPEYAISPVKGESPDWQDTKNSIGIEVSRAYSKHIGYTISIANRFLGKHRRDIPKRILDSFRGSLKFDKERLFYVSDSAVLVNGDRHMRLALEKAKEKLTLLNGSHFKHFEKNCLFLYLTQSPLDRDINLFMSEYSALAKEYCISFNHVFLMAFDSITHIDFQKGIRTDCYLTDDCNASLNRKTHELRHASTWDEGTMFFDYYSRIG